MAISEFGEFGEVGKWMATWDVERGHGGCRMAPHGATYSAKVSDMVQVPSRRMLPLLFPSAAAAIGEDRASWLGVDMLRLRRAAELALALDAAKLAQLDALVAECRRGFERDPVSRVLAQDQSRELGVLAQSRSRLARDLVSACRAAGVPLVPGEGLAVPKAADLADIASVPAEATFSQAFLWQDLVLVALERAGSEQRWAVLKTGEPSWGNLFEGPNGHRCFAVMAASKLGEEELHLLHEASWRSFSEGSWRVKTVDGWHRSMRERDMRGNNLCRLYGEGGYLAPGDEVDASVAAYLERLGGPRQRVEGLWQAWPGEVGPNRGVMGLPTVVRVPPEAMEGASGEAYFWAGELEEGPIPPHAQWRGIDWSAVPAAAPRRRVASFHGNKGKRD